MATETNATAARGRPALPRQARPLHRTYARTRDPEAREQLVHRYLPLARHAASRYARGGEPFEDLLQVASIGLLKALDRYDPDRGTAFTSYAMPTMTGELRRHFRDRGWVVRPPRDLQDQALRVHRATEEMQRDLGRAPTASELAERLGLGVAAVLDAREALRARTATSLAASPRDFEDYDLETRLGSDDNGYRTVEQRATIAALITALSLREREIVRLRFDEDLTQVEIGRRIGVSQMQVSRTLRTALEKLRRVAA
jgi:RNA polymerase sigma-B factor